MSLPRPESVDSNTSLLKIRKVLGYVDEHYSDAFDLPFKFGTSGALVRIFSKIKIKFFNRLHAFLVHLN